MTTDVNRKPVWIALAALALLSGGLAWQGWGPTKTAPDSNQESAAPAPPNDTAEAQAIKPQEPVAAPDGVAQEFSLSEEESLQGSIKSVSCFPEGAGSDVLSTAELTPPRAGIQAMEGCLDLVGARHPEQAAIQLTTVFYLAPDGTVSQTGVGADVASPKAWNLLEPCARDYWFENAPRVRASDEKSFSCVYSWSRWSLAGGVNRVGSYVPSVLSGHGTVAFGTSVTGR
jgi:hypothetical protein